MSLIIRKCAKTWLKEALSVIQPTDGRQILTLKEFITATDFAIDEWSMDKFFHNIKDDVPIYMDHQTIEWFGYGGTFSLQKQKITNLLKKNFAEYENELWFEYSNKDYVKFYEENPNALCYPDPTEFRGKNKTKHMIVELYVFKMLIMLANTKSKFRIMDYYITLEDLVKKYFEYQCEFYKLDRDSEYTEIVSTQASKDYTRQMSVNQLERELNQKYRIGCVYFIQEQITKNIKIGWCWHLPTRLMELQVANSQFLTIKRSQLCQFPKQVEAQLHKIHDKHLIRGEWFTSDVLN
jgi:hypothetical protein